MMIIMNNINIFNIMNKMNIMKIKNIINNMNFNYLILTASRGFNINTVFSKVMFKSDGQK